MYEFEEAWRAVDRYFVDALVDEDDALRAARESARAAGMPSIEVAANQGKLLALLAQMTGARRVLEFGTFAGYSTIWLGRAVGAAGHVTTLEADPAYAALAAENLERAGLADRVTVVVGPALDATAGLIADGAEPFDLVFIDADKPSNPAYLAAALRLTRPGSVIIGDNVVRDGEVADPDSDDPRVRGVRSFVELMASTPGLDATAIQTVGAKGWDGFSLARVVDPDAD